MLRRISLTVPFLAAAFLLALACPPAQAQRMQRAITPSDLAQLERMRDSLKDTEALLTARLAQLKAECDTLYAHKGGCPLRNTPSPVLPPIKSAAPDTSARRAVRAGTVYGALAVGLPALNWKLKIDTDAGGYRDSWRSHDKVDHALLGVGARGFARSIGVHPWTATVFTCGGFALWELSQGYVSGYDVAASCGAAVTSHIVEAALRKLFRL